MRTLITWVTFIILASAFCPMGLSQALGQPKPVVRLSGGCLQGPHKQPDGPFAVMAFCEDALGNYIMLYYADIMGAPSAENYPKWALEDRVWQDKVWGADVTAFAWGPDKKHLYVATSSIYGSGGLFDIDLVRRTARRIFPKPSFRYDSAWKTEIVGMDKEKNILKIKLTKYPMGEGQPKSEMVEISIGIKGNRTK